MQSTNPVSVDFPPSTAYDLLLNWRIDRREYDNATGLEHFPPSVDDACSHEQQYSKAVAQYQIGNDYGLTEEQKRLLRKLDKLVESPSAGRAIISWIHDCHSQNLKPDVDRLARYAVYNNKLDLVKYLVEHNRANLTRRDILGRSAIFYALSPLSDIRILKYVVSEMRYKSTLEELNHKETENEETPLHRAVSEGNTGAVEFLLALSAKADIKNKRGETSIDFLLRKRSEESLPYGVFSQFDMHRELRCQILLLEFNKLLRSWPESNIGCFRRPSIGRYDIYEFQLLDKLQEDLGALPGVIVPNRQLRIWLHIPWANGIVAYNALRRYRRDIEVLEYATDTTTSIDTLDIFESLFRGSINVSANHGLPYTDHRYESNLEIGSRAPGLFPQVFIVLPCLILRTKECQTRAKVEVQNLRANIMDEWAKNLVQPERTLDEAYFPSLTTDALDDRNKSQVISREYRETHKDTEPILMVSQLWLWRHGHSVLTAFSANNPGVLTYNEYVDLHKIVKDSAVFTSPAILIGHIIAHHISAFGSRQVEGKFPSPLDIFESSVSRVLIDVDEYMNRKTRPEMKKEHEFMFRIADIREELVMIQEILGQQLEIVKGFIADSESSDPESQELHIPGLTNLKNKDGWKEVKRSVTRIEKYKARAKKIDGDAERVEQRIQNQLNLIRTHVSIEDARAGLMLSTAVIGFTVITIIFAPLAFVTALFALPVDTLLRNQFQFTKTSGNLDTDQTEPIGAYSAGYVATWFVVAEVVSLVVTGFLVVLCLWLLGGTKTFSALQGNSSGKMETRDSPYPTEKKEDKMVETGGAPNKSNSRSGRWRTGLRRRYANTLGRKNRNTSADPEAMLEGCGCVWVNNAALELFRLDGGGTSEDAVEDHDYSADAITGQGIDVPGCRMNVNV
ncbi:hypothetical protein GGR58DRAFT_505980 [Xylaria digitata]|nr:hypothetical protein GGR58DRAFT_505980 [Xylaria digitata]